MHLSRLDAYFHVASHGDKDAFEELYQIFKTKALNYVYQAFHKIQKSSGNPRDFQDYIDTLFFKTINEYDCDRGPFSTYVEYVFTQRLLPKVQSILVDNLNKQTSLDEYFDDSKSIELIADPNAEEPGKQIAIANMKLRMSSRNNRMSNLNKLRNKILLMIYAGYSNIEICKELHLTLGQLRGHLAKLKKDEQIINFNLEMK